MSNYGEAASVMRSLLNNIGVKSELRPTTDTLTYVMITANASVIAGIVLITLSLLKRYIVRIAEIIK